MAPFADDELDEFYRRIEANTTQQPRRNRTPSNPTCPTPQKDAYLNVHAVDEAIIRIRAAGRAVPTLHSYECVCGSWHLTSRAIGGPDGRGRRKRS